MWNCTSKWIGFKCVIEYQFYYVNECGTECEIVHQSKRRFEQNENQHLLNKKTGYLG